ncbi:MAG: hypothetical protein ABSF99_01795 [Anaerolineales bacterium]|jgi:hypothetical protein
MLTTLSQNNIDLVIPDHRLILKYEGENDLAFLVSDRNRAQLSVPKNRNVPKPLLDRSAQPLKPVFRLLALAFLGLAPAGLGTLVLAPLAALWALALALSRPLSRENAIRVVVVWALVAGLLAIAIPLCKLFLANLS